MAFAVSGANTASGSCVTGSNGQCSFSYTGANVGTDTITASGTVAGQAKTATATKIRQAPANQPPQAQCTNVTVSTDPGVCDAATASVDAGSFDPDGTIVSSVQTPAGPYSLGGTTVTLTVTDNNGASDSCSATVTVVDQEAPAILCPAPQVVECTDASGNVGTATAAPTFAGDDDDDDDDD